MSDDVLSTLITVLGTIATAAIAAFGPYLTYLLEKRRIEIEEKRFAGEQEERRRREGPGGKGQKPGKGEQSTPETPQPVRPLPPEPKVNWRRTLLAGILAAVLLVTGRIIYDSAYKPPAPAPTASLAAATVEFQISGSNLQIIVPAGGTLDTLDPGDQVSIETHVKDTNGAPYPNPLSVTYYFSSGATLTANNAPYLVKSSDTISVKIEDQATGEVITRIMHVSTN